MATHSSVLAWRIPGTEEPGGLPSMGSHRVGHNWSNLAAAAAVSCKCLKTTLHVNLLLCLSCGPETQVLYLPSPPATKVNPGDTFVPILGALSLLLWTLPARLVSFQAPPGFPPFVSQHSCLPSVFNDGIWSPRPNFWKSLRAVGTLPPIKGLCFNLRVPLYGDSLWLSLHSQGPSASLTHHPFSWWLFLLCPPKGVGWGNGQR